MPLALEVSIVVGTVFIGYALGALIVRLGFKQTE
jgi:predicted branched-subunit amino acid permease